MPATTSEEDTLLMSLLSLPSELRLHIYSYLGPVHPQATEIYDECIWKAKADDNAKAVASLHLTCSTIHQDLAGLCSEMRQTIITIGQWSKTYDTPYQVNPIFEEHYDLKLDWLLRMQSIKVFLWIDLDQCPEGDEDIEKRNCKEIRKIIQFEDIVDLLRSSIELEAFSFHTYVTPESGMWASLSVSIVGKQLLDLQDEVDAEAKHGGWSRKDTELEHATRAVPLLRLGVEDPQLLDPFPDWPSPKRLQSEVGEMRLWRGAFY